MRQGSPPSELSEASESQTIALMIVATLLIVGAAWLFAGLLVPFFLAVILAVAISPVAAKLERFGVPKTLASLICVLTLAAILAGTAGLVLFQAGTVLRDSDRYVRRFSEILATVSQKTGGDQILSSLELIDTEASPKKNSGSSNAAPGSPSTKGDSEDGSRPEKGNEAARSKDDRATQPKEQAKAPRNVGTSGATDEEQDAGNVKTWIRLIHRGMRQAGGWIASGLGGLLGVVGGVVVFLAYFFYMLETRGEWIERITTALRRLGLRPTREQLAKVQKEVVTYFGCLSLVAVSYSIVVSLILWAIGVPQYLLWGVLAGLMEFIPYFGPLISSVAPTIVALSLEHWWQPALVALQFIALHLVEGYVVTPLVYGQSIRINPVTILFGALFFGWVWGPLGLAMAVPMMIILRGLLAITPDTPALDALADLDKVKDSDGGGPGRTVINLSERAGRSPNAGRSRKDV